MLIKYGKMLLKWTLIIIVSGGSILLLARLIAVGFARPLTFTPTDVPPARVAIVFGAGLLRDGSPTPVLRDRITTAAELFFNGKVEKLLMSGDNRFVDYNEPGSMKAYAIKIGVPEDAIILDYAGRRTYDTCYRAHAIFGLDKAIIITQEYHLPRALYLCNQLGLSAVGVSSDLRTYQRGPYAYWTLRELAATVVAFWEVLITHPLPVLGKPEPIFPSDEAS
jgi:SanA protein